MRHFVYGRKARKAELAVAWESVYAGFRLRQ